MDPVTLIPQRTAVEWAGVLRSRVADLRGIMDRARQGRYGVRNAEVTRILEDLEEAAPHVVPPEGERDLDLRQCVVTAGKAWDRLTQDGRHSPDCTHTDPAAIKRCCAFHACSCGLNALLQELKAVVSLKLTLPG